MVWGACVSGNHTRLLTSAEACLRAEAERAEQRPRVPALRPGLVRGSRRGAARRGAGKFVVQAEGGYLRAISR